MKKIIKIIKYIIPFCLIGSLAFAQSVMVKTPSLEQVLRKNNNGQGLIISNVELRVISVQITKQDASAPSADIGTNGTIMLIFNNTTNILLTATNGAVSALIYQLNGTNTVPWFEGSIGGTSSVYFIHSNGTNYHIRIE